MAESRFPPPDPWALDDPQGDPVDPALGGPLRVAPPPPGTDGPSTGLVVVATDALLAHAERLTSLASALVDDARALAHLPPVPAAATPTPALLRAAQPGAAQLAARTAAEVADQTRVALRAAIERYAATEAEARVRIMRLAESVGVALAPVIRMLLLVGLPALVLARVAGSPDSERVAEVRRWLVAHPELITNPVFVEAVRSGAMGIDETISATVGERPDALAEKAGGYGFDGVEVGAAVIVGAATPFGLFRDGPVSVDRVSTLPLDRGPRGAVERLARVPEGDQVRIERYEAPGEPPRYIVYVGPTETFSPVARDEPWDLTSNVAGVAGFTAGSIRATEAAMHDAGIAASDAVQFVGFSQGGLVAARLAAGGDWNAAGLETYGAPTGNVMLPAGLPGMAVRNTDDFVPALAGPQLDHTLLQIERRAFAPGSAIPSELPAPAHQRSAYVATATEIDAARSEAVRAQLRELDAFTTDYTEREGSRVTVMIYHADRSAVPARGEHVEQVSSSGGSTR